MADRKLSWEQVVQMCRHVHLEEDEELVTAGVQVEQLDLEAASEVEVNSMARTILWDSSLAKAIERRRRDEVTNLRCARLARASTTAPAPPAASSRSRDCE